MSAPALSPCASPITLFANNVLISVWGWETEIKVLVDRRNSSETLRLESFNDTGSNDD